MDDLTFFANIISSLAWPIVVIVAIVIYRVPISQVILSLKRIKYQDLELDFEKELAQLKSEVEQVAIPQAEEPNRGRELPAATSLQSQIEQVASISPASAVALAWAAVDSELQKAIMRLAISPDYPPHLSPLRHIELLKEQKLIDAEMYHILQRMRILRNKAAHMAPGESCISVEDAMEYSKLTMKVLAVLQSLQR
jgi:hypothetical protein